MLPGALAAGGGEPDSILVHLRLSNSEPTERIRVQEASACSGAKKRVCASVRSLSESGAVYGAISEWPANPVHPRHFIDFMIVVGAGVAFSSDHGTNV